MSWLAQLATPVIITPLNHGGVKINKIKHPAKIGGLSTSPQTRNPAAALSIAASALHRLRRTPFVPPSNPRGKPTVAAKVGDRSGGLSSAAAVAVAAGLLWLTRASPAAYAELVFREPEDALSLPTWAIHVSSVIEWVTAMALVWRYGEQSGFESWKGMSLGMVPLLGGAFCACTWHFFYNAESLDILVALQAALTVLGNFTMCIAAISHCEKQ